MDFLVGVKEVGEILGWDRRKVSTYHFRGVLPKPLVSLSSGPIWLRKQIESYKTGKESGIKVFYMDQQAIYECKQNHTFTKTHYSLEDVKQSKSKYKLYMEKDVQQLKQAIVERNPIAQFLSFETISFLYDYGMLETEVFHDYIQQYFYQYITAD